MKKYRGKRNMKNRAMERLLSLQMQEISKRLNLIDRKIESFERQEPVPAQPPESPVSPLGEMQARKEDLRRERFWKEERRRGLTSVVATTNTVSDRILTFDELFGESRDKSTKTLADMIKTMDEALIPHFERKAKITEEVKRIERGFDKEQYIRSLVDLRNLIAEAELTSIRTGLKMDLKLPETPQFQKVLAMEEYLNKAVCSPDDNTRLYAQELKNEMYRQANIRAVEDKIRRIAELSPEELEEMQKRRGQEAKQWLDQCGKEVTNLFHRPNDLLGMYILASLMPIPGLLLLAPTALMGIAGVTKTVLSARAGAEAKSSAAQKTDLAKAIVVDNAVSALLRTVASIGEMKGEKPGEILNTFGELIYSDNSILRKVSAALENRHIDLKDPDSVKSAVGMVQDMVKPLNDMFKKASMSMGEVKRRDWESLFAWNGGEVKLLNEKEMPQYQIGSLKTELRDLSRSIQETGNAEDWKKYLVRGAYAFPNSSASVVQVRALLEGIREGAFDQDKEKMVRHLLLRFLPSSLSFSQIETNDGASKALCVVASETMGRVNNIGEILDSDAPVTEKLERAIAYMYMHGAEDGWSSFRSFMEKVSTEEAVYAMHSLAGQIVTEKTREIQESINTLGLNHDYTKTVAERRSPERLRREAEQGTLTAPDPFGEATVYRRAERRDVLRDMEQKMKKEEKEPFQGLER